MECTRYVIVFSLLLWGSAGISLAGEPDSGPLFGAITKLCEKFDAQAAQSLLSFRSLCGGKPASAAEVQKELEEAISFVCLLLKSGSYTCIQSETTGVFGTYQDGGIIYEKTDRGWRITVVDRQCVKQVVECLKWMRDIGWAAGTYETTYMKPAGSLAELQTMFPEKVHERDPWGNEFQVELSQQHHRVLSPGPDGKPKSGDEIVFEDGCYREILK
jgi:hypothetical protein